jgi:hypothetical protein
MLVAGRLTWHPVEADGELQEHIAVNTAEEAADAALLVFVEWIRDQKRGAVGTKYAVLRDLELAAQYLK